MGRIHKCELELSAGALRPKVRTDVCLHHTPALSRYKPHMNHSATPSRNFPHNRVETTQTRLTRQWKQPSPGVGALNLPDGTHTVLLAQSGSASIPVCHLARSDAKPLCGCHGSFTRVAVEHAQSEVDRLCESCRTQQNGVEPTRPCPRCGAPVRTSAWPQHVRSCENEKR